MNGMPGGDMPENLFETALIAFTTFFATMGPVDVAAIYAALTVNA